MVIGEKPPTVEMLLLETVKVGVSFTAFTVTSTWVEALAVPSLTVMVKVV